MLLLLGRLRFQKHWRHLLAAVVLAWGCVFLLARTRNPGRSLSACSSNLKNLGAALEMYSADSEGHYPATMALLTPNYLKTIPTCPSAGTDTYSASYRVYQGGKVNYTVFCQGHNHESSGTPPDYPRFHAITGISER